MSRMPVLAACGCKSSRWMYRLWVMLPVSAVVVLVTAPRPPRKLSTISLHVVDVHQI